MIEFIRRFILEGTDLRAQLLRGSLGSAGIKAIYFLVQFSVGVILARVLGPKALGIYAFIMALVHLFVVLSQFGFPAFLVRSIAVNRSSGNYAELKGLILGAGQIVLILSLLLSFMAFLWLVRPGQTTNDIYASALIVALLLLPFLSLTATFSGATRGLGNVIISQLPESIIRPTIFLILLLLIVRLGATLEAKEALMTYACSALIAMASSMILLRHCLSREIWLATPIIKHREWMRQSFPFLLLAGAQVLNHHIDVLMLGVMTAQEQVGLYRVAIQVADGLGITLFAISVVIAPQLARLHALSDWSRIQKVLVYSHRGGALVMLPLGVTLAVLSIPFLTFIFGEKYSTASGALEILVLGKIAYATVGFVGLALSMLGRAGVAAVITFLTVIINVTLNALLIPRYGIEGAAMATVISQFGVNLATMCWMWNQMSRNFSAFALMR